MRASRCHLLPRSSPSHLGRSGLAGLITIQPSAVHGRQSHGEIPFVPGWFRRPNRRLSTRQHLTARRLRNHAGLERSIACRFKANSGGGSVMREIIEVRRTLITSIDLTEAEMPRSEPHAVTSSLTASYPWLAGAGSDGETAKIENRWSIAWQWHFLGVDKWIYSMRSGFSQSWHSSSAGTWNLFHLGYASRACRHGWPWRAGRRATGSSGVCENPPGLELRVCSFSDERSFACALLASFCDCGLFLPQYGIFAYVLS
jgi:hypothetical protein